MGSQAYTLHIWDDDEQPYRFSLEHSTNRQQHTFADLAALTSFLSTRANVPPAAQAAPATATDGPPRYRVPEQEPQQAAQALRDSQSFIQHITDSAPYMIYVFDLVANHDIYVNRYGLSFFGSTLAELQHSGGAFYDARCHPDDLPAIAAQSVRRQRARDGDVIAFQYRIQNGAGEYRWLRDHQVIFQRAPDGSPAQVLGTAIDITEQMESELALHESQSFIQHITDTAPYMIYVFDVVLGRELYHNRSCQTFFGYTLAELPRLGNTFYNARVHPDDQAAIDTQRAGRKIARDGQIVTAEYRMQNAAGEYRWLRDHQIIFQRAPDGSPTQVLGTAIDITEQKQAEQALRENQMLLQSIVEHAPLLIVLEKVPEEVFLLVNPLAAQLIGHPVADLIGCPLASCYDTATFAQIHAEADEITATGKTIHIEYMSNKLDGTNRHYMATKFPVYDAHNTITAVGGFHADVTHLKHLEAALRQANNALEQRVAERTAELQQVVRQLEQELDERQRAEAALRFQADMLNTVGQAVIATDMQGRLTFWNRHAERTYGWRAEEVLGQPSVRYVLGTIELAEWGAISLKVRQGLSWSGEFTARARDGRTFPIATTITPLHSPSGALIGVVGVSSDVSARKQNQQALSAALVQMEALNDDLRRNRDLLGALFDHLDDGLALVSASGRVLAVNQAFATLCDTTSAALLGGPQAGLEAFMQLALDSTRHSDGPHRTQERYTNPAGRNYMLDIQTIPLPNGARAADQIIIHVADRTEQIQLQVESIEQERFAASGRLAASVAHEVNTPLQAIESCLHLASTAGKAQRNEYLTLAREEIQRIGAILHQFLDLYRPDSSSYAEVDLNKLIKRVVFLLGRRLAQHNITVDFALMPDLPSIWARADELTQVLLNLNMNAVQAMPGGGRLHLHTAVASGQTTPAAEAAAIVIEVRDSGVGISAAVQERLFEPFFTTHADGFGLDLTVVQKIVAAYDGQISIHHNTPVGSIFSVRLPLQPATGRQAKDRL